MKILLEEGLLKHQAESVWNGRPSDIKKKDLQEIVIRNVARKTVENNWLLKLLKEQKQLSG